MNLDFSKCKTKEDVEKFLEQEKGTFELLRKLAAVLEKNIDLANKAAESFEKGSYGEMSMAEVLEPAKKGVAEIDHISMNEKQAGFANVINANNGHPQAAVRPGVYARLHVNKELMMTDTPHEVRTCSEPMLHAHGDVLIAGLGLGMILIPILRAPKVDHVTLVEKYPDVVDVVVPQLRKVLDRREQAKLHIVEADIFKWKPPSGTQYDCMWFDIWPRITTKNLPEIAKLHRLFGKYRRKTSMSWMKSWMHQMLLERRKEEEMEEQLMLAPIGGKLSTKAKNAQHVTTNGRKVKL